MTRKEACLILGISPDAEKSEIKKRYRQMMRQVHPDGGAPEESGSSRAQEVNLAYEILSKETLFEASASHGHAGSSAKKESSWNAPTNPNAFREREIFHYAEDYEGNILGNFSVARGKYLWSTEEDFPLFLLSMYQCGKELLDEIDDRLQRSEQTTLRREIQPELTYLLSQQFTDGSALLKELAKEKGSDREGNRIFYVPAMLELEEMDLEPKKGDALFPARLRKHRLYLKNQAGRELGYLSFPDDRLYYVIIPLFEQKRARIRLQAAGEQKQKGHKGSKNYQNLHLWIKVSCKKSEGLPESLNLQIERLLENYEKSRHRYEET